MRIVFQPSHWSWKSFRVRHSTYMEVENWAEGKIKGNWSYTATGRMESTYVFFEQKQDAMLFKLAWSDYIMKSIFT